MKGVKREEAVNKLRREAKGDEGMKGKKEETLGSAAKEDEGMKDKE